MTITPIQHTGTPASTTFVPPFAAQLPGSYDAATTLFNHQIAQVQARTAVTHSTAEPSNARLTPTHTEPDDMLTLCPSDQVALPAQAFIIDAASPLKTSDEHRTLSQHPNDPVIAPAPPPPSIDDDTSLLATSDEHRTLSPRPNDPVIAPAPPPPSIDDDISLLETSDEHRTLSPRPNDPVIAPAPPQPSIDDDTSLLETSDEHRTLSPRLNDPVIAPAPMQPAIHADASPAEASAEHDTPIVMPSDPTLTQGQRSDQASAALLPADQTIAPGQRPNPTGTAAAFTELTIPNAAPLQRIDATQAPLHPMDSDDTFVPADLLPVATPALLASLRPAATTAPTAIITSTTATTTATAVGSLPPPNTLAADAITPLRASAHVDSTILSSSQISQSNVTLHALASEFQNNITHFERVGSSWNGSMKIYFHSKVLNGAAMQITGSAQQISILITLSASYDNNTWLRQSERQLTEELARRLGRNVSLHISDDPAEAVSNDAP